MKRTKAGLPPGTLVHVGEIKTERVKVTVMAYDEHALKEFEPAKLQDAGRAEETPGVTWINVDGLHEVAVIEALGKKFGLHPLALEDVLHADQRPKLEDHGEYLYVVLKMLYLDDSKRRVLAEQVSLIVGARFVITFQEGGGDVFAGIRDRLRSGGKLRKLGADFLAHSLIDAVVDQYFVILEMLGESIEGLDARILKNPRPEALRQLHELKRTMLFLRKSVWPLREVVSGLERLESPLRATELKPYLRDLYDHTIQVIDSIETMRDLVSGLVDLYVSSLSNRLTAAMKTLAVIATIFMPLSFVAGFWGMNFENLPGLHSPWGYPAALLLMIAVTATMLLMFRRKGWL